LRFLAERIDELRVAKGIRKWHVVGHDAGSVVAGTLSRASTVLSDRAATQADRHRRVHLRWRKPDGHWAR
jgi:hypothetical protein